MTLRNTPTQTRAVKTLESIEAAALVHYDEVGRDRFNTTSVAKLAGVSIGTLYRYFEDKVELLNAVRPDRDKAEEKLRLVEEALSDSRFAVDERIVNARAILDLA